MRRRLTTIMLEMNGVSKPRAGGDGDGVTVLFAILFAMSMIACALFILGVI